MGDLLGRGRLVDRVVGRSQRVEIGRGRRSMIVHEVSGHAAGDPFRLTNSLPSGTLEVGAIQAAFEARAVATVVLCGPALAPFGRTVPRTVPVPTVVGRTDREMPITQGAAKLTKRIHGTSKYWTACREPCDRRAVLLDTRGGRLTVKKERLPRTYSPPEISIPEIMTRRRVYAAGAKIPVSW